MASTPSLPQARNQDDRGYGQEGPSFPTSEQPPGSCPASDLHRPAWPHPSSPVACCHETGGKDAAVAPLAPEHSSMVNRVGKSPAHRRLLHKHSLGMEGNHLTSCSPTDQRRRCPAFAVKRPRPSPWATTTSWQPAFAPGPRGSTLSRPPATRGQIRANLTGSHRTLQQLPASHRTLQQLPASHRGPRPEPQPHQDAASPRDARHQTPARFGSWPRPPLPGTLRLHQHGHVPSPSPRIPPRRGPAAGSASPPKAMRPRT